MASPQPESDVVTVLSVALCSLLAPLASASWSPVRRQARYLLQRLAPDQEAVERGEVTPLFS